MLDRAFPACFLLLKKQKRSGACPGAATEQAPCMLYTSPVLADKLADGACGHAKKLFNAQHGNKIAQAVSYPCKCRHNLWVKLTARTLGNFAAGFIK